MAILSTPRCTRPSSIWQIASGTLAGFAFMASALFAFLAREASLSCYALLLGLLPQLQCGLRAQRSLPAQSCKDVLFQRDVLLATSIPRAHLPAPLFSGGVASVGDEVLGAQRKKGCRCNKIPERGWWGTRCMTCGRKKRSVDRLGLGFGGNLGFWGAWDARYGFGRALRLWGRIWFPFWWHCLGGEHEHVVGCLKRR